MLLAGGGVQGGVAYGESDGDAAWVKDRPVHIRDICATIYHSLGIDPESLVHDQTGRPVAIARGGRALVDLF